MENPDLHRRTEYQRRLALQHLRPLRTWERELLSKLISAANLPASLITPEELDLYRVREMLDGGMGSLRFTTGVEGRGGTRFSVAELWYTDADGVPVSFALNVSEDDEPWEIDAWKVDSTPLLRPPAAADLRATW